MRVCGFLVLWLLMPLLAAQEDEADQFFPMSGDYAASHILVAWRGAPRVRPGVNRSKTEARQRARELAKQLLDNPDAFEALARAHSDGISAQEAGYLGSFPKGRMERPFEAALAELKVGDLTREPVKTSFGYHIIRREPMVAKRYAANMLLLTHSDARSVRGLHAEAAGKTRTRGESRQLAEEFKAGVDAAAFYDRAREQSDLRKVFLGVFREGEETFTDRVIQQLKTLKYDQIGPVLDSEMGFLVLQRIKVERRAGACIRISFVDATDAPLDVVHTRAQARALIEDLAARLGQDPSQFEELARTHSDHPGARGGGKLPSWYAGYQPRALELAYANLAPGALSPPIETPQGFFILRREED